MAQIRFADIVGKTIQTCFVPADGKAVTFVLAEGRMSLGAPVVRLVGGEGEFGGAKITSFSDRGGFVDEESEAYRVLYLMTDKGYVAVWYYDASALTELPE